MSPKRILVHTMRQAWRLVILVTGLTVVLVGLVMVVTPGPAIVVVPLGLAILGVEFAWARRLLTRFRERAGGLVENARRRTQRTRPEDEAVLRAEASPPAEDPESRPDPHPDPC